MKSPKKNTGFTLIEVLMAAMLIGVAIAALAASSGAFTMYNAAGVDLSTSEFLIEEVREMTAPVSFANLGVCAYDGPARDANGEVLSDFSVYTQQITVQYVNPANLAQQPYTTPSDLRRVTVNILKGGQVISSSSWIRANY